MQSKKPKGFDGYIGIRTTEKHIEAIDEIASKNHRTRADEIRKMLDEYIEKHTITQSQRKD